jgi:hypothetical protein
VGHLNIGELNTKDTKRLTVTKDFLFLLKLLRRHQASWKFYTTLMDADTQARFFLAEDRAGRFHHPVTGAEVVKCEDWSVKERVRPKKVRDHFFSRYSWRFVLRSDYQPDYTIRAGRMTIWKGGRLRRVRQLLFSLTRKYPLGGRFDRLLASPGAYFERIEKVIDAATPTELESPYFCPLDGVVKPIEIELSSPAWTWKELCGRQWTSEVCPCCLFEFNTQLTLRS